MIFPSNALPKANAASVGVDPLPSDLKAACREMERYFYDILIKSMRQAMVPQTSKGADSFAKETSVGMLDEQWARIASEQDGMGLAQSMFNQLSPEGAGVKPNPQPAVKNVKTPMIPIQRRSFQG